MELQIVTANGRRVWVRAIGEPVTDAVGDIVQVQGGFQDLTMIRALADERQQAATKLTATLESLADGFLAVDHGWRIIYINPEAARVLQVHRRQLLGRNLWHAFPEAMGTRFETEYRRALREGVNVELTEYFAPLQLWVRVRAWPTGEGLALSFVNVTAQIAAETQLRQLNAELEERIRQRAGQLENATHELKLLSYAVEHDVRAPLASIHGFSAAIEHTDGATLSPKALEYLIKIRAAADWMNEMTQCVLHLGRISEDSANYEEVDLSHLATQVWDSVSGKDTHRQCTFEVQPALKGYGSNPQLRLVLQNLLGNAWKFTAGKECVQVRFALHSANESEQVFLVEDNGAGFDPQWAHKLFSPFSRLHSRDEFDGNGLGLAIVRKVLQLHGGRVWAE